MERCPLCKGEKKNSTTTYSVDLETGIVIVRHVPCHACIQCGEEWIESNVAKKIEDIVEEAKNEDIFYKTKVSEVLRKRPRYSD